MQDIVAGDGDWSRRLPDRGKDELGQVASAFNRLVDRIHQTMSQAGQSSDQLAQAAEQHTLVAEEIDRSVVRISQLSESAANGSQQTAQESEALVALGEHLHGLVGQFR